jgi:4-oxalocrotonate tautomerase
MALIQVKLVKRISTETQTQEIIRKLTNALASLEEENMRSLTWVVIEEATGEELGASVQPVADSRETALAS